MNNASSSTRFFVLAVTLLVSLAILPFSPATFESFIHIPERYLPGSGFIHVMSELLPTSGGTRVSQASAVPVDDRASNLNEDEVRLAATSAEEPQTQTAGELAFVEKNVTVEKRLFAASGRVRNQSGAAVVDAQVTVTLLDWRGGKIGTKVQRIGTLQPGKTKPYSVKLEIDPGLVGRYSTSLDWQHWQ